MNTYVCRPYSLPTSASRRIVSTGMLGYHCDRYRCSFSSNMQGNELGLHLHLERLKYKRSPRRGCQCSDNIRPSALFPTFAMALHAGSPISTCTQRVATVPLEKQVPFHLVEVDMSICEHTEHLERQPFGQIPYIEDDGFFCYETRAIGRYIATNTPTRGRS